MLVRACVFLLYVVTYYVRRFDSSVLGSFTGFCFFFIEDRHSCLCAEAVPRNLAFASSVSR